MTKHSLIPIERIQRFIYVIRGQRVMMDSDLAKLYGVSTKALNQAVKRNHKRFPADFMFQLDEHEAETLRSQIVTSNAGRGGRRYLPFAFTEHGAVMLANVLKSDRAIDASVQVVRAFVRLREFLATHKELAAKLAELERKVASHDGHIQALFEAIHQLMNPPDPPRRKIGFHVEESKAKYRVKKKG